jgi:hypothetical protein
MKIVAERLEGGVSMEKTPIVLEVDGESIPMNPFVQKIFINTILGMVRSLDKVKEKAQRFQITIQKEVKG